jgi:hypothetical protein
VDEPFGPYVADWQKSVSDSNHPRLTALCALLGLRPPDVQGIRYQLLHRTASALLEAERFHATATLMLVHSFHENHAGFDDYAKFVQLLNPDAKPEVDRIVSLGEQTSIPLYAGWVADA